MCIQGVSKGIRYFVCKFNYSNMKTIIEKKSLIKKLKNH